MKTRATIILKGRVQQAGYRDHIDEQAFNLNLTGNAKNLDDGTVRVICEGDKKTINKFIERIRIKQYPISVEDIELKYSEATGEFKTFDIIWEDDITKATFERMATAARYMREMNTDISGKIDNVGGKIEEMNTNISGKIDNLADKTESGNKILGGKIEEMNTNISGKIDNLADKTESGNKTLGGRIDNLGGELGGKMDNLTTETRSFHQDMSRRFDIVEDKYGIIAEMIGKAVEGIEKTNKNTGKILARMEKQQENHNQLIEKLIKVIINKSNPGSKFTNE